MINPVVYGLQKEVEDLQFGKICRPKMAILIPTYKCNQLCKYCFFKHNNNGTIVSKKQMLNIIDQLNELGVRAIEFCGGGEPTLMPEICEVVEYASQLGMNIGLLTNGVNFTDEIAETFLKYSTYVRFSLDTVNPELYKKIRGKDDCETVVSNIEQAFILKQRYDYMCQISLKIALYKEIGLKEIQEVFNFARGKRVFSVQVKNTWDENGNYYNNSLSRIDVYRQIKTYGIKFVKNIGNKRKMKDQCWINPIQISVDAYGDCYVCCNFQGREDKHKFGNLFEKPLIELWGSGRHKAAIRLTKMYECMKFDCRLMKYMEDAKHQIKTGEWHFV